MLAQQWTQLGEWAELGTKPNSGLVMASDQRIQVVVKGCKDSCIVGGGFVCVLEDEGWLGGCLGCGAKDGSDGIMKPAGCRLQVIGSNDGWRHEVDGV